MTTDCIFVSDLHGKVSKYEILFNYIENEKPKAVFLGGDLLPASVLHSFRAGEGQSDFTVEYLGKRLKMLQSKLGDEYPQIFVIMGNDDPKSEENSFIQLENENLWKYIHGKTLEYMGFTIFGYSYIPPTPFMLKDWEKYDSKVNEIKPGSIEPGKGFKTQYIKNPEEEDTIMNDILRITRDIDPGKIIGLFHSPPYKTSLDRAALDKVKVNQQSVDNHVGSGAIKQYIVKNQPYLTLHGHIHESSRITGKWKDTHGKTISITAAFEGPGVAIIKFDIHNPQKNERVIIQ